MVTVLVSDLKILSRRILLMISGFSQTQRQTQQTYGSYNNEHYDAPSSYSQGSQGNQVAYVSLVFTSFLVLFNDT